MKQEDYVSFETAKLLKEKGFNEPCIGFYNPVDKCFFESIIRKSWDYDIHGSINAPTLQMAMKWLREVHKLYIEICTDIALNLKDIVFRPAIFNKKLSYLWESDNYPTYEQAAEAAIKYCLTNLI